MEKLEILIVDDVKDNLLALSALLVRDDVTISQALTGNEALELMVKHDFCLAIVDIQMPEMNGFELAEFMRGTNKTKNIPIIFVTATAKDEKYAFKGYESGAVDFLRKPLDPHAVKSKVNVFLELHKQKKELNKQVEALKQTREELEQAIRVRDEFMSIASHELKTPLTSLKLQSHLRKRNLKKGDLSAFTPERLTKMFDSDEKQLERITHLIDDMLDISRISSGKLSMNLERFDLCELIRDIVEQSSEQFVAAGCPIKIEVCQSAVGSWDRFRIEQMVMNLLTNAMRYGAGKLILLQVIALKDRVQIVVHDQGRGIAEENHERIFRKFERAVLGSEISGLGLGLYIVRQILDAHHGSIRLESQLGQGATFVVELPLLTQVGSERDEVAHHGL